MTKIFLVHGWTHTLDKWHPLVNELIVCGFEPVLLRVPGLTQPSEEVWDIPKYVEWLHGAIDGAEPLYILGQSNGGRIAMAYDQAHPGKIKHLFLVSAAGVYDSRSRTVIKRLIAKPIAALLKPIVTGKVRRVMYRIIGGRDYGNASENMQKTMQNVTGFDKTFDPSCVSAPTTLIWGSGDTYTPLANARVLEASIQHVDKLVVFDGVGHSSQFDKAGQVAAIIADTLKKKA